MDPREKEYKDALLRNILDTLKRHIYNSELTEEGREQLVSIALQLIPHYKINVTDASEEFITLLSIAAENKYPKTVARLIKVVTNWNELFIGAINDNYPNMVKTLLDAGVDPNHEIEPGRGALHYAIEENRTEIAKILLEAGADPSKKNAMYDLIITPLHLAIVVNNTVIAELLQQKGAPCHTEDEEVKMTPLTQAVAKGNTDMVTVLLKNVDWTKEDKNLTRLLTCAITTGKVHMVNLILHAGADPNEADIKKIIPLPYAIECGHPDIVQALLAAGADPNLETENGLTPIEWASDFNQPLIMLMLLKNGADLGDRSSVVLLPLSNYLSSQFFPIEIYDKQIIENLGRILIGERTAFNPEKIDKELFYLIGAHFMNHLRGAPATELPEALHKYVQVFIPASANEFHFKNYLKDYNVIKTALVMRDPEKYAYLEQIEFNNHAEAIHYCMAVLEAFNQDPFERCAELKEEAITKTLEQLTKQLKAPGLSLAEQANYQYQMATILILFAEKKSVETKINCYQAAAKFCRAAHENGYDAEEIDKLATQIKRAHSVAIQLLLHLENKEVKISAPGFGGFAQSAETKSTSAPSAEHDENTRKPTPQTRKHG